METPVIELLNKYKWEQLLIIESMINQSALINHAWLA